MGKVSRSRQLRKKKHGRSLQNFTRNFQGRKFEIYHSGDDRGLGVFARQKILQGSLVGEYKGELINVDELKRRMDFRNDYVHYIFQLSARKFIDANVGGDFTSLINHSRNPNVVAYSNSVGQKVEIFTLRQIEKGEQLYLNYGKKWFKDNKMTELDTNGVPY